MSAPSDFRDEPRAHHRTWMERLARKLKEELPRRFGFMLLVCDVNDPRGQVSWMSSVDRRDAIDCLEILIARLKEGRS